MSQGVTVFDLTIDPTRLTKSEVTGIRVAIGISGLVAVVLGIIVLVWPSSTLSVLAVLFGLYFLIAGIVRVARGLFTTGMSGGLRILAILLGLLLIIAGIITIRNPLDSLVILGMVIGISWIIEGVAALVETAPDSSKWFGTLFGAISIIAGIIVLLTPLQSIGVLVIIGGIFLIASGLIQVVQAFTFGRASKRITAAL
ncbi:hypothetical protein GCM10022381_09380 [Leifsonia kafniensis]|uniref:HdeD family acid-resistance protein n=1 Tax=Leifsonia kafniensis TaxID=475957 RepID=A0ABP7K8U1_9MICO